MRLDRHKSVFLDRFDTQIARLLIGTRVLRLLASVLSDMKLWLRSQIVLLFILLAFMSFVFGDLLVVRLISALRT